MAAVAGAVIAGATLGVNTLTKILEAMTGGRKIAIGISNETGTTWTAKDTYLDFSTTSDVVPPLEVENGKALLYSAKAVSGLPMAGITGAIAYSMSDGNTLIFIFSVPYNYAFYDNWWNVRVYKGEKKATEAVFDELYSSRAKPIKGNDGWKEKDNIGEGYKAKGVMSSSGNAPLLINVMKQ